MKLIRLISISTCAVALTACGNSINSREDAARAMQRIAAAGSSAGQQGSNLPGAGLDASFTVTVPGKSGSATVTIEAMELDGLNGMTLKEKITYDEFTLDGENTLDGTMEMVLSIDFALGSGSMSATMTQEMKGQIEMTGEYDSTLDFDVRMTANLADMGNQSGASIELVMDGTVTADGQTFTWANEKVVVETVDVSS